MSCNRDSNCKVIANNYHLAKQELKSDFASIKNKLNDINDKLTTLNIPDDYLGNKVHEKLEILSECFQSDESMTSNEENSVMNFATSMQNEHDSHYNKWYQSQKLKKNQDEVDNG